MTLLFILLILAVFVGGVCLWISGYTVGARTKQESENRLSSAEISSAKAAEERALSQVEEAKAQVVSEQARVSRVEAEKSEVETEMARVATELERVEREMNKAADDLKRLTEENEELRKKVEGSKGKIKPPSPPVLPVPKKAPSAPVLESEELDSIQVQLDMERVAHGKTRDELEQVKRLIKLQSSGAIPSVGLGAPGSRKGAGFKTMSIDTRSQQVTGTEHDRLRQAYDQLQRDKERVDTDLARAQQELQLLKMRQ